MSKTIQIRESLSEEKLKTLGSQLKSLPTSEEFKQRAENNLWDVFTGQPNAGDEINYEELSESSKGLIGTVSSGDDKEEVPWWLKGFGWTATSIGEEEISLTNLSKFQNFVPEQTIIRKPELLHQPFGISNDLYGALEDFKSILKELEKHLDLDHSGNDLSPPENTFTTQDGGVQTTNEFREWFNSLVNLCPPFDERLTALLMLNSKVKEDLAEEILPEEVMASIENIGLINSEEIYNEKYFKTLKNLLACDWSVFDLQAPYVNKEYDSLTSLESALFESWAENNSQFIRQNKSWFYINGSREPNTIDNETKYAQMAVRSPLTRKGGRAVFVSLSLRGNELYSTANQEQRKREEIDEILESFAGVATDD